jgi:hypothetical protein
MIRGDVLLDDRYAPITSEIGFLRADARAVADAMVSWRRGLPHRPRVVEDTVTGSLEELLATLTPLDTVIARRHLVIPTTSEWTAFVDNRWTGPEVGPVVSVLAERVRTSGVRAFAAQDRASEIPPGRYGGAIFELYGPHRSPPQNLIRSISAVNDGGAWDFETNGEPLPFEREEFYRRRRIADRFNAKRLEECCEQLGIRLFDADFYAPGSEAILVSKPDQVKDQETMSLEAARRELGIAG